MELKTCRICANSYDNMKLVSLFSTQENIQSELKFITKEINAWNLNISPNDGLSQSICDKCFSKFLSINTFRQECLTTQKILRNALPNQAKCNAATLELEKPTFMVQNFDPTTITQTQTKTAIEEPIVEDETEKAINIPPDIVANYKITFDENVPTNIVISNEGLLQVSGNGVDNNNITSTNYNNNVKINYEKNLETQDLEEMLTGCIIPKNLVKNNFNKRHNPRSQSIENGKITKEEKEEDADDDDEDAFDKKSAQCINDFAFVCNYCYCPTDGSISHLVFKNSEALSQHFFDVHDPKFPYPCPKCPKLFDTNRTRNIHVSRVHNQSTQRLIKCPYCRLPLRVPLEAHERNCIYVSDWACDVCKKEFRKTPVHVFRAHQRLHLNSKFRCEICNREFMRQSNYEAHKKTHSLKYATNPCHVCVECKQTFASETDLKAHELLEHDGKTRFRCFVCDRGFSSFAFLQRHIANFHSIKDASETTCSNCAETFSSKLKLCFHQQRPKDENGQCIPSIKNKSTQGKLSCQQCTKHFSTKNQFDHHLELHDARLRPYACEHCVVRCRTSFDLKQHVSFAHSNIKGFTCDRCNERFRFKKDLDNHKLYHAKLTYKCKFETSKVFCAKESDVQQHFKNSHEPVPCEHCGEVFTPDELKIHRSVDICLANADLNKIRESTEEFKLNNNENGFDKVYSTNSINGNVSVQFVNEGQQQSYVLNYDDLEQPTETQQNVLEFLQAETIANLINGSDVPLSDDDFFMSSLLDPDNEIVVT